MHLEVNGTLQRVQATDLAGLLAELGFDSVAVATALNGDFVPRALRGATPLAPGARIEILAPMQGG